MSKRQCWKNQVSKEKGVPGPSFHLVRIVNNTTAFVLLEIFLFRKQTFCEMLFTFTFFFLHQIVRHLTQKFLSDTPDLQHCERRGIHCSGLCLSPRQHMHLFHKKAFIHALLILKKSSSYSAQLRGLQHLNSPESRYSLLGSF